MHKLTHLSGCQNHKCCYCGVEMTVDLTDQKGPTAASVEHVIPLSKGGRRAFENEVAACKACNSSRGNMDAMTFYHRRQILLRTGLVPPGVNFGTTSDGFNIKIDVDSVLTILERIENEPTE